MTTDHGSPASFWRAAAVLLAVLALASWGLLGAGRAEAASAPAAPSGSPSAADELRSALEALGSFQARFQQLVIDPRGQVVQESEGRVALRRPANGQSGGFRWETIDPFPQLLVSDGDTVWLHDPDLEQVTIRTLDSTGGQTPVRLLAGDLAELERAFRVSALDLAPDADLGQGFVLEPTGQDALFTELALAFDAQGALTRMELTDAMGQVTRVAFADVMPLDALVQFAFLVPAGVDVIDDRS